MQIRMLFSVQTEEMMLSVVACCVAVISLLILLKIV